MGKTAFVFPGQGSQLVGMGADLAGAYPRAREIYQQADNELGYPLSELCFSGPAQDLNDTINTQPAIFVSSLAALGVLQDEFGIASPKMVAGHSLGELTALVAAGAMTFSDGLRLVQERGRLMKLAGERNPGGMAAVLKIADKVVEEACLLAQDETDRPVQVANYNSPGQVVISGDGASVTRAIELLKERGGRRVIRLAVSIAAHSPLMAGVVPDFRAAIDATPLRKPAIPIVANINARPLTTVDEIRDELAGQLTKPVRWTDSVRWMAGAGISHFIEVGPKDVLCKLVGRIDSGVSAAPAGDVPSVRAVALLEEES